jgi:hypothetical protein
VGRVVNAFDILESSGTLPQEKKPDRFREDPGQRLKAVYSNP